MREMGSSSKGWLYVVTALLFCGMIAGLAGVLLPNWFVVQCHGDGGLNPGRPTTYSFGLWSMCVGHRTQAMLTFLNGDCLTLQSALRPGYRLPGRLTRTTHIIYTTTVRSHNSAQTVAAFAMHHAYQSETYSTSC